MANQTMQITEETIFSIGQALRGASSQGSVVLAILLSTIIDWYTYECLYGQLSGPAVLQKP